MYYRCTESEVLLTSEGPNNVTVKQYEQQIASTCKRNIVALQVEKRCWTYSITTYLKNCHPLKFRCCKLKQHVVQQVELASTFIQQIFSTCNKKILLRGNVWSEVVIRGTTLFNLQRDIKLNENVARITSGPLERNVKFSLINEESSLEMLDVVFRISAVHCSCEAKHSNRSCYANLQLSVTIKTIVNLHSITCCYAQLRHWITDVLNLGQVWKLSGIRKHWKCFLFL